MQPHVEMENIYEKIRMCTYAVIHNRQTNRNQCIDIKHISYRHSFIHAIKFLRKNILITEKSELCIPH